MSEVLVPSGSSPVARHKWETIRYAIGDTARTIRLCAVLLTLGIVSGAPLLIMALAHGWLG